MAKDGVNSSCGATKGRGFYIPILGYDYTPLLFWRMVFATVDINIKLKKWKIARELNGILLRAPRGPLEKIQQDTDRDFYLEEATLWFSRRNR